MESKLQGFLKRPKYLNVLNHDIDKERKYGVFSSINIIQEVIWR